MAINPRLNRTGQRGGKHHMKHCQKPNAEKEVVKGGTSTT